MNSLGDLEEVGIAPDHEPADVEAGSAAVGEQRLQHLGNAAAGRGGVDVQHRPASQERLGRLGDRLVTSGAVRTDQGLEPGRIERLNVDLLKPAAFLDGHVAGSSSTQASIASQSRASLAGSLFRGKRSFDGSITPPKTATERGSSSGVLLRALSSWVRASARSFCSAVFGPSAKTAKRERRQLLAVPRKEAPRVLVPAPDVQRAPEDDAVVGRQVVDVGRAAEIDLLSAGAQLGRRRLRRLLASTRACFRRRRAASSSPPGSRVLERADHRP